MRQWVVPATGRNWRSRREGNDRTKVAAMRLVARYDNDGPALDHLGAWGGVVEVADQNLPLMGKVWKRHIGHKKEWPRVSGARLTPGLAWNRLSGPLSLCFKQQTQAGFRRRQKDCASFDGAVQSSEGFPSLGGLGALPRLVRATLLRFRRSDQARDFFDAPHMGRDAGFHRRRDLERLVDAREVVVHEV